MKVILKDDVLGLGEMGDVVNATDGYARNYLIPREIAMPASKGNLSHLESLKKKKELKREDERKSALSLSEKLNEFSCTIPMKVGDGEKLFGSVSSKNIAEKLVEAGFDIDKRKIVISEPIKKLGVYAIPIKVYTDVTATIKLWVIDESEKEGEKEVHIEEPEIPPASENERIDTNG